jgi:hypothetical protein
LRTSECAEVRRCTERLGSAISCGRSVAAAVEVAIAATG